MKKLLMLVAVCVMLCACGRKWEQLWGQDTKPETKYIPMTADTFDIGVGTLNPVEWMDRRIRDARWLSVWACADDNLCVAIPEAHDDLESIAVYTRQDRSYIAVYNVQTSYPGATKIRIQYVK